MQLNSAYVKHQSKGIYLWEFDTGFRYGKALNFRFINSNEIDSKRKYMHINNVKKPETPRKYAFDCINTTAKNNMRNLKLENERMQVVGTGARDKKYNRIIPSNSRRFDVLNDNMQFMLLSKRNM